MLAKVRAVNMLFDMTDLCIYVPILAPVTGFKDVGLSWVNDVKYVSVHQLHFSTHISLPM